jgi:surface polysaccharide O-acyltransferase-like enzyme
METRKYFLDWLRVIAFGLLIIFHVGMLYVPWPYNLKSPRLVPGIEWAMETFSAWRMPLLFVISGVASTFLIGKLGPGRFALDRVRRLQPVILFGMFVVIPPQTWIELIAKGVTRQSYLHFWWYSYLRADQTLVAPLGKTMPTWDHLWFLVYLFVYSMLFALGVGLVRLARLRPNPAPRISIAALLIGPALWLVATNILIDARFPLNDALVNDWGGHLKWIGMFITGALCAGQPQFWAYVRDRRLALAAVAALLLAGRSISNGWVWSAVSGLYGWVAICAICGFAYRHLDRPSPLLSHLNEGVLPVYVLHQPILLLLAYCVFPLKLPLPIEGALLAGMTGLGAFAVYESAIRPFAISRFLFGLKPKSPNRAMSASVSC